MIRRPPRSTPLYSSAASDVYKRQEDGEERSSEGDVDEPLPVPRDVQVDEGIREGFFTSHPPSAQALAPHPVQEDDRPHGEEGREDHVGEDADIGTVPVSYTHLRAH